MPRKKKRFIPDAQIYTHPDESHKHYQDYQDDYYGPQLHHNHQEVYGHQPQQDDYEPYHLPLVSALYPEPNQRHAGDQYSYHHGPYSYQHSHSPYPPDGSFSSYQAKFGPHPYHHPVEPLSYEQPDVALAYQHPLYHHPVEPLSYEQPVGALAYHHPPAAVPHQRSKVKTVEAADAEPAYPAPVPCEQDVKSVNLSQSAPTCWVQKLINVGSNDLCQKGSTPHSEHDGTTSISGESLRNCGDESQINNVLSESHAGNSGVAEKNSASQTAVIKCEAKAKKRSSKKKKKKKKKTKKKRKQVISSSSSSSSSSGGGSADSSSDSSSGSNGSSTGSTVSSSSSEESDSDSEKSEKLKNRKHEKKSSEKGEEEETSEEKKQRLKRDFENLEKLVVVNAIKKSEKKSISEATDGKAKRMRGRPRKYKPREPIDSVQE